MIEVIGETVELEELVLEGVPVETSLDVPVLDAVLVIVLAGELEEPEKLVEPVEPEELKVAVLIRLVVRTVLEDDVVNIDVPVLKDVVGMLELELEGVLLDEIKVSMLVELTLLAAVLEPVLGDIVVVSVELGDVVLGTMVLEMVLLGERRIAVLVDNMLDDLLAETILLEEIAVEALEESDVELEIAVLDWLVLGWELLDEEEGIVPEDPRLVELELEEV